MFAISQPVVSTPPQIGDQVTNEYAHTTGILPGAAGTNLTWDYSNLMDSATVGTVNFVSAASTPYVADFPGAQIATVVEDTLFSYIEMTAGSPYGLGLESPSQKFVYAHPLSTLLYPFTYHNSFYDSVTLFLVKPITGTSKLLDSIMVSGYGTLKLPGNTYNNVLQTREIIASSGSITVPEIGVFPVPPTSDTTYAYYVNGQPSPLLFYSIDNGVINVIDYLRSSTVMPLHFISFTAAPDHGDVKLNWQTGDELNTNVFHIQRGTNGSDFSNIGDVNASGSGSHNYNFTDIAPLRSQTLYYRLQETDIDGENTYSNIVEWNVPGSVEITSYPNPANSLITIMGIANYTSLKIYNLSGQQLKYYNINGASITVPLTSMVAGVYIAELSNESKTTRIQFLKK
ncbi:MAG: T9SS type A sorting domain-containing protein [Mucilaginibacter sp.]